MTKWRLPVHLASTVIVCDTYCFFTLYVYYNANNFSLIFQTLSAGEWWPPTTASERASISIRPSTHTT